MATLVVDVHIANVDAGHDDLRAGLAAHAFVAM
jgi:hypothetical protein